MMFDLNVMIATYTYYDGFALNLNGGFPVVEPQECFETVLSKFCEPHIDEKLLLNYLNAFVKLLAHYEGKFKDLQFSRKDILFW